MLQSIHESKLTEPRLLNESASEGHVAYHKGVNKYLLSILQPDRTISCIPDTSRSPYVLKQVKGTYNLQVPGAPGTEGGLVIVWSPQNPNTGLKILIGVPVTHPVTGATVVGWSQVLALDEDLSQNYSHSRLVSAVLELFTSTIPSGAFSIDGRITTAVFYCPVDYRQLNPNALTPYNTPFALQNVSVQEGIVSINIPQGDLEFQPLSNASGTFPGTPLVSSLTYQSLSQAKIKQSAIGATPSGWVRDPVPAPTVLIYDSDTDPVPLQTTDIGPIDISLSFSGTASDAIDPVLTLTLWYVNSSGVYQAAFSVDLRVHNTAGGTVSETYTQKGILTRFPIDRVTLSLTGSLGPTTYHLVQGNLSVTSYSSAQDGLLTPVHIMNVTNFPVDASITANVVENHEAIPNLSLSREVVASTAREGHLFDFDFASIFLRTSPFARAFYKRTEYMLLVNGGRFTEEATRDALKTAYALSWSDVWSGIKSVGRVALPFVPKLLESAGYGGPAKLAQMGLEHAGLAADYRSLRPLMSGSGNVRVAYSLSGWAVPFAQLTAEQQESYHHLFHRKLKCYIMSESNLKAVGLDKKNFPLVDDPKMVLPTEEKKEVKETKVGYAADEPLLAAHPDVLQEEKPAASDDPCACNAFFLGHCSCYHSDFPCMRCMVSERKELGEHHPKCFCLRCFDVTTHLMGCDCQLCEAGFQLNWPESPLTLGLDDIQPQLSARGLGEEDVPHVAHALDGLAEPLPEMGAALKYLQVEAPPPGSVSEFEGTIFNIPFTENTFITACLVSKRNLCHIYKRRLVDRARCAEPLSKRYKGMAVAEVAAEVERELTVPGEHYALAERETRIGYALTEEDVEYEEDFVPELKEAPAPNPPPSPINEAKYPLLARIAEPTISERIVVGSKAGRPDMLDWKSVKNLIAQQAKTLPQTYGSSGAFKMPSVRGAFFPALFLEGKDIMEASNAVVITTGVPIRDFPDGKAVKYNGLNLDGKQIYVSANVENMTPFEIIWKNLKCPAHDVYITITGIDESFVIRGESFGAALFALMMDIPTSSHAFTGRLAIENDTAVLKPVAGVPEKLALYVRNKQSFAFCSDDVKDVPTVAQAFARRSLKIAYLRITSLMDIAMCPLLYLWAQSRKGGLDVTEIRRKLEQVSDPQARESLEKGLSKALEMLEHGAPASTAMAQLTVANLNKSLARPENIKAPVLVKPLQATLAGPLVEALVLKVSQGQAIALSRLQSPNKEREEEKIRHILGNWNRWKALTPPEGKFFTALAERIRTFSLPQIKKKKAKKGKGGPKPVFQTPEIEDIFF